MASEEMMFLNMFFFVNLVFRLPWQPIKLTGLDKIDIFVEDYSRNISVNVCQNICSEMAINANFHFSHYKSMKTLFPQPINARV